MALPSSTIAWKIPWTEEPGGLQSVASRRVRHDWATSLSLSTFMHWRRKWQPTPVFLPGETQDGGAWWAAVCGVAQGRTRLKRLSSSRSRFTIDVWKNEWINAQIIETQFAMWGCGSRRTCLHKLEDRPHPREDAAYTPNSKPGC